MVTDIFPNQKRVNVCEHTVKMAALQLQVIHSNTIQQQIMEPLCLLPKIIDTYKIQKL